MKKHLMFLAVCLWTHLSAEEIQKFNICQKDYRFSTVFEMESQGRSQGMIIKTSLRFLKPLRDAYDAYDKDGNWEATGIGRVFCLGFFRPWGAEFDVYDTEGSRIGVIDGQLFSSESAKYSIYNEVGERVGIAYMDLTNAGFSIVHPEKTTKILARLTRDFVQDQVDQWEVANYAPEAIDERILKVFAAFAVDKQEYFKEDN
jgi:hypothetical protein